MKLNKKTIGGLIIAAFIGIGAFFNEINERTREEKLCQLTAKVEELTNKLESQLNK